MMKLKYFLFFICLCSVPLFAQKVKKPSIMILPSDKWCTQRFFMTTYQNQGQTINMPDYQKAFREDLELKEAVAQIREIFINAGYDNIKDCEVELQNVIMRQAEDNNTYSKSTGANINESPLDILKRRTKCDILIYLDWDVHKVGNEHSVSFTIEAIDAYSSKVIATATGISDPSSEIVPIILKTVIYNKISTVDMQLVAYFNALFVKGREIVLTLKCWDSWDKDLETMYDGEELLDIIQDWMHENTIEGSFNLADGTENIAQFEQVRIPLFDDKNRALDARGFATMLRKYLASAPYLINCKVMQRGLGEAIIVLGEK